MIEISKNQKLLILFLLLVLLLPFLYLFAFTHPIADDLSFGYQAKQAPLFNVLVNSYFYSNGLYTGNLFMFLFPVSLNELGYYRLFLVTCFVVFCASSFYFITTVFPSVKHLDKIIITLFFVSTVLGSTTHLSEAFYWQTSVIYYQLSLCFALCYFGLLIQYFQRSFIVNKTIHQLILVLTLILIIGMKESIALIMGFIAALLFYYSWFKTKENKIFFTIQLLMALVFISILVFAPGNDVRMGAYPNNKNFSRSFIYTILQMGRFSVTWLFALSGILFVFIVAEWHQKASPLLKKLNWKMALIVFFGILFLCIFPAYWATGILGQHRTLNLASLFFILFLLVLVINKGEYFMKLIPFSFYKKGLFFGVVFLIAGNGFMVVLDIFSGRIKSYDKQLTERAALITKTKSTAHLPLLTNVPKSLFVVDIQQDTSHWINKAYLLGVED